MMIIVWIVAILCAVVSVGAVSLRSQNTTGSTILPNMQTNPPRYALVIALAGSKKLTEYFKWSCRTIYDSRDRFDLLVFHENNQLLRNVTCAENVKFYNLGERGLSQEIVRTVMNIEDVTSDGSQELVKIVDNILQYIPTYLSELKPMMGSIFERYLKPYSYWTYSDPDIIYGSLTRWISDEDLHQYHYYSLARHWDASRLFLRSQFTLHRNVPEVTFLWQRLTYFRSQEFANRVGSIWKAISEITKDQIHGKSTPPTESITRKFFHNPEGWYSKLVFEEGSGQVKIVGRVFDDFFREPVIRIRNPYASGSTSTRNPTTLLRCQQAMNISHCIDHFYDKLLDTEGMESNRKLFGVAYLPPTQMKEVEVHVENPEACKMAWLPIATRSCIATEKFHHGSNHESNAVGKQQQAEHKDSLRLSRVGECILTAPLPPSNERVWQCNDEKASPRQVHEAAAFFHFHHWDEYVAMSKAVSSFVNLDEDKDPIRQSSVQSAVEALDSVQSSNENQLEHHTHVNADCLVLYLRYDRALVLESCATAKKRETLMWTMTKTRLLLQHYVPASSMLQQRESQTAPRSVSLADSLSLWRRKIEIGSTAKEEGDTEEDMLRRENRRNKQRVMNERARRQQRKSNNSKQKQQLGK